MQAFPRFLHLLIGAVLLAGCSSSPVDGDHVEPTPPVVPAATPRPFTLLARGERPDDTVETELGLRAIAGLSGKVTGMGLEAIADPSRVELGEAIPIYYAGADPQATRPIAQRLGQPHALLVPVLSDGRVVTSLTMIRGKSGQWEVGMVGRVDEIRSISYTQSLLSGRGARGEMGLVIDQGAGARFLVREEAGQLVFTPFSDRGSLGLPVGEDVAWSDVERARDRVTRPD